MNTEEKWMKEFEAKYVEREMIHKDKALEYVLENFYDEVREAVFEQEADNLEP